MADIHGPGGTLSHKELTALFEQRSGFRASKKNCATCATDLQNAVSPGSRQSGGTALSYNKKPVFHFSHGQRGKTDGCTIFVTLADSGSNVVAGLVGVGRHTGEASYKLDWGPGGLFAQGKTINL